MTGFCHDRDELARNPFAEMRYHALRRFANRLGFQPGSSNKEVSDMKNVRKMIAAFDLPENKSKGVVSIDGRMVERLHAEMARRTVAIGEAIAARG